MAYGPNRRSWPVGCIQALPLIGMESAAAWMQSCVVTPSMWSCVIVVVCL